MPLAAKKRASKQAYQSLTQLTIEGFETPLCPKIRSCQSMGDVGQADSLGSHCWYLPQATSQPNLGSIFH
jgi:hypothetical protein